MTQLILIRHGETLWNTERRMQGQLDSPLTERGLWQAQQEHGWQASGASEWRRRRLLPSSPALDWSELMTDPQYMAALDALP
jgi:phosphohistidine phosphatase SixA